VSWFDVSILPKSITYEKQDFFYPTIPAIDPSGKSHCAKQRLTSWTNLGASGINTSSNFVIKDHMNSLYRLTLSNINEPLAIKLEYLKATQADDHIQVSWATSGEMENDSMRVEAKRSASLYWDELLQAG